MQLIQILKYPEKFLKSLKLLTLPYQIGFVIGHSHLTNEQISKIRQVLNSYNTEETVNDYEQRFAELIGTGYGISFAAGRMAFYVLMKALEIGKDDEVILLGFTCSVIPNAVLRIGASPVFSDIDCETFGSDAKSIEGRITSKTKLIVAQHSFGIPCKIKEIVEIAKKHNIFLVEDCAIAFDSAVNGIKAGNWGDAAIFSTDHTKPLNTLIGGFLYTKDKLLYEKVKRTSVDLPHLDKSHQERLFKQFIHERINYIPEHYPRSNFINKILYVGKKINPSGHRFTFLEADYRNQPSHNDSYPYPAKMPPFLSQIGLFELDRWEQERKKRKSLLREYLNIAYQTDFDKYLPKAYADHNLDIVPHRFVFTHPNSKRLMKKMNKFIDANSIWFRQPIVCCPDGPESLGYKIGSCPNSEKTGSNIINWPCIVPDNWTPKILDIFQKVLSENN